MDVGSSYCHHSTDTNGYASVAFDTDDDTFHTTEDAAGNTDGITFLEGGDNGIEVDDLLFIGAAYGNEATHLRIRDDKRTAGFTVDNVTHCQRQTCRLLDTVDALKGRMDKDEIMHNGH